MRTDLTLKDFALVFIVVVIIGSLFFGWLSSCDRRAECLETSIDRPCVNGTVSYDSEDGECECLTEFGELEWELDWSDLSGCDLD